MNAESNPKAANSWNNISTDIVNRIVDKILLLEKASDGARIFWFIKGLSVSANVAMIFLFPRYRLISSVIAGFHIADSLVSLGCLKYAEEQDKSKYQSIVSEFQKKFPTPQSFLDSINNSVEALTHGRNPQVKKEDLN